MDCWRITGEEIMTWKVVKAEFDCRRVFDQKHGEFTGCWELDLARKYTYTSGKKIFNLFYRHFCISAS